MRAITNTGVFEANYLPRNSWKKYGIINANIKRMKTFLVDAVEDYFVDMHGKLPERNFEVMKSPATDKLSMTVCLFDTHFGSHIERVDNDGQNTKVIYSLEISKARVAKVIGRALQEMKERGEKKFDEFNIVLGGDNIEGDGSIYRGQVHHLEVNATYQVTEFVHTMTETLLKISEQYPDMKIRVHGIIGNHGEQRGNPTMNKFTDNYDFASYIHMQNIIGVYQKHGKLKNVALNFETNPTGPILRFEIKGHGFMGLHKYAKNLGTPSAGRNAMSLEKMQNNLKIVLTGHYHQSSINDYGDVKIVRIGSLVGPNSFTDELSIYSPGGEQALIISSKDEPMYSYSPIPLKVGA